MADQSRQTGQRQAVSQPSIKDMDTSHQVDALIAKENDPVFAVPATEDKVKQLQAVFTAMKKHLNQARAEASKLDSSDELAAMLGHLNMAEVAMDTMIAHAEGSLV